MFKNWREKTKEDFLKITYDELLKESENAKKIFKKININDTQTNSNREDPKDDEIEEDEDEDEKIENSNVNDFPVEFYQKDDGILIAKYLPTGSYKELDFKLQK